MPSRFARLSFSTAAAGIYIKQSIPLAAAIKKLSIATVYRSVKISVTFDWTDATCKTDASNQP